MRSNQQNKRSRGRNNNHNRKNSNPLTRSYESNGPDIRVRGNAAHVAEKYMQLARDANSSGDSVAAENYLQHAEHYFRIISAAQAQQAQQQANLQAQQQVQQQPDIKDGSKPASSAEKSEEQNQSAGSETPGADVTADATGQNGTKEPVKRNLRERRPRRRPSTPPSSATPSATPPATPLVAKTSDSVDAGQAVEGTEKSLVENDVDPASAPQPDVSDLPAFVTEEAAAKAVE